MFKTEQKDAAKRIITSGRTLGHVANVYDFLSPVMTFYQESRLSNRAVKLLDIERCDRILDVGCGTGTLTIKIAQKLSASKENFSVIGLDAAPEMIAVAKRKAKAFKNIYFDIGAAEQLPYKDEYFDSVVSTFFFHHINYELKKKSLYEIWRVVKKGGRVVIVDVDSPTNFFGALCAWCGYILFRQNEIKENIEGKLREAVDSCNFRSWYKVSQHLGFISIFKLEK